MTVIRCETCKGTGKITEIDYELDAIGQLFQTENGYYGASIEQTRILEQHTHPVKKTKTCPDCGGSGCKWNE